MNPHELRGRLLVQAMWGELEKIAVAEEEASEPLSADKDPDNVELVNTDAEEDPSPVAGVMGNKIIQKGNQARGIPILQAPEGYSYRPDLQAFAPSPEQGWMANDQVAGSQAVQGAYQKGRQDEGVQRAQGEMSQSIEQNVQQQQQAQQQQQQQQQMQQLQVQQMQAKLQKQQQKPTAPRVRAPQKASTPTTPAVPSIRPA